MVSCKDLGRGRWGNSLFAIACTAAYAYRHKMDFVLSPWKYANVFISSFNQSDSIPNWQVYTEPHFHYKEIPYFENVDLSGYWQSHKYFQDFEQEVRTLFKFKSEIDAEAKSFIDVRRWGKTPVSIHIRRTDYITMSHYYENLSPEWYHEAMNKFDSNHHFFIMSDDLAYCIQNIKGDNITFCGFDEVKDMAIMKNCDHHIICNSSYSWWGSYLGHNPSKRVIAPSKDKWFKPVANHSVEDLYLNNWELL